MSASAQRFGAAYYDRFYESRRTQVQGPKEVARLAEGVLHMIALAGGRVRSVLDVGAGPGLWRDWFQAHHPRVAYRSTDVSPYACERYGHEERDIATWRARGRFDLVICQGVLPYLDAPRAEAAIENLAAMTRGFLYLEAITKQDLETLCDLRRTDTAIHRRSGAWYRRRLSRALMSIGLGLWVRRDAPHLLYELEHGA